MIISLGALQKLKILSIAVRVSVNSDHWLCKGQDHSELQRAISALIFLWLLRLIAGCNTTARSPIHLLLTALWQLNTQVHVLPLVCF